MSSVQEFVKKYDGASVDFDKHYGAQCVDLFNFYNKEVVGAPWIGTPITGGARDLWENAKATPTNFYRRVSAAEQLRVGDVLVYGEPHGRYIEAGRQIFLGHVNIYIGNNRVIEQNGKVSQKTVVRDLYKTGLIGILRPLKFEPKLDPQNVPDQTKNKNKHVIASGDTFWGLEERYNITHGTLQKLNPQLDPRRLAIGTEIVISGEPVPVTNTPTTYYTIKPGDTFWDLENAWQLSHGTLQQLNPGINPRALQIGQRIRRS